jgi:hypothetical protein
LAKSIGVSRFDGDLNQIPKEGAGGRSTHACPLQLLLRSK